MKVKSMKGFTLAELLIVMAIVVVLAAVAVPKFADQLETARETADLEDLRNAYATAYAVALKDSMDGELEESSEEQSFDIAFRQTKGGFTFVPNATVGGVSAPTGAVGKTKATFAFAINETSGELSCTGITAE